MAREEYTLTAAYPEVLELRRLLEEEERHYRRLRRLAWRQTRYLRRQDAARLEKNAEQWQKYMPLAQAARERRESVQAELAARLGLPNDTHGRRALLAQADPAGGVGLGRTAIRLAETAADLYRRNGLNALLAQFCLELTREEAAIFKQCVTADPTGCYAGNGQRTAAPPGGVLWRQA